MKGISEPRKSTKNEPLPSARKISRFIHRPVYRNDVNFTVMLAVWGQFIDHDMTATALSKGIFKICLYNVIKVT